MSNDFAASGDGAAVSLARWKLFFGDSLTQAAQALIEGGDVENVRVLQNGRVITGLVGHAQRVYVQVQGTPAPSIDGECGCRDAHPCVHIAAVVLSASAHAEESPAYSPKVAAAPPRAAEFTAALGAALQQLLYSIEPNDTPGEPHGATGHCQVTVWVTQPGTGEGRRMHPFTMQGLEGTGNYPRYVDPDDRAILAALKVQRTEGPWRLAGAPGFALLQRAVATGRALWQSPAAGCAVSGIALHPGPARPQAFTWVPLPNGDQRFEVESAPLLEVLPGLEPVTYIDRDTGACGPLELAYAADLMRQHWRRGDVPPDKVAEVNARLARTPGFPGLHTLELRQQPLDTLAGRLVLTPTPQATLQFLYNGKPVDGDSLEATRTTVRQLEGTTVHEIRRDVAAETRLRAELRRVLPETPRDGKAWLAFMMHGAPALQVLGWDIEVGTTFPYRLATADAWYADMQSHASLPAQRRRSPQRSREWFDLRLGVTVDGQPVNLLPALMGYLQGALGGESVGQHDALSLLMDEHLLIRLDDGRYLPVDLTRIQRIAETLVELYDRDSLTEGESLTLPAAQAGRLAQLCGESTPLADVPAGTLALHSDAPELLTLIDAVKSFTGILPVCAPQDFQATLRPYQQEGLGWLQFLRSTGLGGILADDMGLGKTVQTLAHLASEKQAGRLRKPSLIVAPVSVLGNWLQEIRRFAPQLRVLTLQGAKRKGLFDSLRDADVVLIGYPLLVMDCEILTSHEFSFVILDEAQTIKNPHAKVSQVARTLRADHRLCLTGTPMENHLGELWSLFDFVQPGLLGDRQTFQRHYRTPIENGERAAERLESLRRRVQPFLLRRTKDAVAADLPAKVQIVEPIDLDERQRDVYDGIRLGQHRRVREAIQDRGLARSHITVLDALLKLRQACCDPRLVKGTTQEADDSAGSAPESAPAPDASPTGAPSAKLEWLRTTLPELIAEGRRILLFSQFTSMLSLIEELVRELGIPYCLLTGETRHRTEPVRRFQTGEVPLFLISLKAGGTGLNLTAADTVIHYDPWWNPAVEAQAADRAHRIGQTKTVFVYKLIARGTVEEKIMQLQADKQALVTQLYTEKNAAPLSLSSADLESLFAP